MAIYRTVHTTFWTDSKVLDDFTPEDKFFMLYLLTNPHTNITGCYEISLKQIARDTGWNDETVINLIKRFREIHKVIDYDFDTKEVLVINWCKYNWTKSEKLMKSVELVMKHIKNPLFREFVEKLTTTKDRVYIGYTYPMDTSVSVTGYSSVSVLEEEGVIGEEETISDDVRILFDYVEDIFGRVLNQPETKTLLSFREMFNDEIIMLAFDEMAIKGKLSISYARGILENWKASNIRSVEETKLQSKRSVKNAKTKEEKLNEVFGD